MIEQVIPFVYALLTSGYFPVGAEPVVDPTEMSVAYFQQGDALEGIHWAAKAAGHEELTEWAQLTATCESGLRYAPKENPGYAGIMQHSLAFWWGRAEAAGVPGADPENPYFNVYVSIKMVGDLGYAHSHWECSPW